MLNSTLNHFPDWAKNLTIYEVNLRQFTSGGTLKEFRAHLPRLKELGVGVLWFMPVQPVGTLNRKGSMGSYYSIRNYCDLDPAFGNLQEFKELIDEIHEMGMYAILDWVANHTAWDHHWVLESPEFYKRNEQGEVYPPFPDWADVVGLDYSNPHMREAMIGSMKFWLENTALDGFRCDMAHLVPTDFWEQARPVLENKRPDLYMLAETDHYDLLQKAFHSSYDWKVFHAMNEVAHSKIGVNELRETIEEQLRWYPSTASLMRFISNHDENSWQGSELERLAYFLEPMTVLYFTLPGIPLIYSGQEAGNYRRLSFFDKDEIEWKQDKMAALLRRMAELRKLNPALWSAGGDSGFRIMETSEPGQILAFERLHDQSSVLVFLNLSYQSCRFHTISPVSGQTYQDLFSGITTHFGENACMELSAFGYAVFVK